MAVNSFDVNCIACLVKSIYLGEPLLGWRDEIGIVHRACWAIRGGCFKLCDFREPSWGEEKPKSLDVSALIRLDEFQ